MLIVSTNISDIIKMAESVNIEDLEDGEIESDGEESTEVQTDQNPEENNPNALEKNAQEKVELQEPYYSKSGKKKKSKSNKGEQKFKDKSKKSRKYTLPAEDDHASKIEKAIRKALNKNDDEQTKTMDEFQDRRKHKKRKKYDGNDASNKKRKKHDFSDDVDESEMVFVRGASPIQRENPPDEYQDGERDSYESDTSQDSREHPNSRQSRHRSSQRERSKSSKSERRRNAQTAHPMQDADGVCLYYMQGKCHKGDDCVFSHDAQPPRKMELCKFYLMDCCAKRDKCLYMHSDFPCKYYHTGLPCIFKDDCKFAHGKPLNDELKNILLKHIESAPKEILGDFPRLNREGAMKMIQNTQTKLIQQYPEHKETQEKTIPSLFELNIPNPQATLDSMQFNYDKQNKNSPKIRQSRWQNDNSNQNYNMSPTNNTSVPNVLSIKNLTGVLTPRQISDLTKMGIENLDQLGQLSVFQLNSIGLSLKQISEIQQNTMSIQKLGLINNSGDHQSQHYHPTVSSAKDLDLRVAPVIPVTSNVPLSNSLGKDVDMRFQPALSLPIPEDKVKVINTDINKDAIDIDQYTKDALKFASKEKENIDISNDCFDNDRSLIINDSKDVDHRVLTFADDSSTNMVEENSLKKEFDTDIRFLPPPQPLFKSPEKRNRRSTTDDEDNNLLIDEKWYSSDEEKATKTKSPVLSPQSTKIKYQTVEPSSVLSKLGDLSQINISEEVTKLLNTMKNNLQDKKQSNSLATSTSNKPKDPRNRHSPDKNEPHKCSKRTPRLSIYDCIEGEPTDGRRRSDVDLRHTDYKLPTFGDTDLRQSTSGDIDFRLGLPFKAIPNYTPASEIDGSFNSHPPIAYKLVTIDIPRPDYTDIRNSTAKSQALVDPRLRKVFRLSLEDSSSDTEKSSKATPTGPRVDPRRKPKEIAENILQEQKQNSLDLQTILQNSTWYKELSSTQKIFVNQHLAPVTQTIKQYQQDKKSGKKLDLVSLQTSIVCNIFTNLGISLSETGEYSYLPKPKEALLKTPTNFNQTPNMFGINNNMPMPPNNMDTNNMNMSPMTMGGVGTMNTINVGPMASFNQPFPDPRGGPTPGLLGIAPNMPHNFNNFGGANNFGNMAFNGPGPGNEFNFGDAEQNFQRFSNNRGGSRGQGERWNRGGSGRGNRGRKNFSDRGNWKNDRH